MAKKIKMKTIKVSDETYDAIKEIAKVESRFLKAVVDRAVQFYKEGRAR